MSEIKARLSSLATDVFCYRTMPSTWTQLCHCINVDRGLLKVKNEELRNYCWQTHTCTGNLFLAIFFAFIKFYNVFIFCQTPSQVGVKLPPPQMAQSSNSITQRQKNHLLHKFSFPLQVLMLSSKPRNRVSEESAVCLSLVLFVCQVLNIQLCIHHNNLMCGLRISKF